MTEPNVEVKAEEKTEEQREKDKGENLILKALSRKGLLPEDLGQWERKGLLFQLKTSSTEEGFEVIPQPESYILKRRGEEKAVKEGNRTSWMAKAVCQKGSLKPLNLQLIEGKRRYPSLESAEGVLPKMEETTNISVSTSGEMEIIVRFPHKEGSAEVKVVKKEGGEPKTTLSPVLQGDREGEAVARKEVDERLGRLLGANVNIESGYEEIKELLKQKVIEELTSPSRSYIGEEAA